MEQIRAEKLSPEERAASARKAARARWHDASAVLTIRDMIRGLENGTLDLDKARWVEGFAKNLNQRAELIHQADQLGIDPRLFTHVTKKQIVRLNALLDQLTSAISSREGSQQ